MPLHGNVIVSFVSGSCKALKRIAAHMLTVPVKMGVLLEVIRYLLDKIF